MNDDKQTIAELSEHQQAQLTPEEAEEVEVLGAAVADAQHPAPGTMKIDLHCHTEASWDCVTALASFPARLHERGIRVQAITDHNEVWGAQKLRDLVAARGHDDLTIIVGEEVTTSEGEIIGLFLKEKIEAGQTPEATIAQIREQGGLVLLPHGFDPLKRYRLQPAARERVAAAIDIVETFNARVSRPKWNRAAVPWSEENDALMSAGSDAHTLADVGSAWVEVPLRPITTTQELLLALENGTPIGEWTHPVLAFMYKMWDRFLRKVKAR